ncbi:hypothetical protein ACFL7M_09260 [Thermodesulfobacteriota bacterium]
MPVLLFPYFHTHESVIEKVSTFFGPITIYLPWFQEPPEFINYKNIEISYPPDSLKPKDGFKNILSEYHHWVEQNRDKSYLEIIKSDRKSELTDNSTWEIRQMLGRTVQSVSGTEEEKTLRWHLLLHLAREIEEQLVLADRILKTLKDKNSLLEGSIESAEEIRSLLGDLPSFEPETVLDDFNFRQIFDAWFSLFEVYLNENELLITFNRYTMDYLSEQWDNLYIEDKSTNRSTIGFKVPDLSYHAPDEQDKIEKEYNIHERLRDMKDLIFGLEKNPTHSLAALDKLSKEFDDSFPWELSGTAFNIMLKYFYPISDKGLLKREKLLRRLSRKTIILVEECPAFDP